MACRGRRGRSPGRPAGAACRWVLLREVENCRVPPHCIGSPIIGSGSLLGSVECPEPDTGSLAGRVPDLRGELPPRPLTNPSVPNFLRVLGVLRVLLLHGCCAACYNCLWSPLLFVGYYGFIFFAWLYKHKIYNIYLYLHAMGRHQSSYAYMLSLTFFNTCFPCVLTVSGGQKYY